MMPVLFHREPEDFWQASPRERPLWALVVALATLAVFVAALCVLAVGARADEATPAQPWWPHMTAAESDGHTQFSVPMTTTYNPPTYFHRTRCLPVGSDQIVDCWVETQHER